MRGSWNIGVSFIEEALAIGNEASHFVLWNGGQT